MVESESRGHNTDFDLSEIVATSDSVRLGCINALMGQYQRMSEQSPRLYRSLKPGLPESLQYHLPRVRSSQEWRRDGFCDESMHHDSYRSRTARMQATTNLPTSAYIDQDCLLRFLHSTTSCEQFRGNEFEPQQSFEAEASSLSNESKVIGRKKSRAALIRSSEQTHGTKYHKLSAIQAFVFS
jgi:hypothetical protein